MEYRQLQPALEKIAGGSDFRHLFNKRIPLQKALIDFAAARKKTGKLIGGDVKKTLKFASLLDILPRASHPALIGCGPETRPLTHFRLVEFISKEFNLEQFGLQSEDRVGICLPQGPELVVCILATVSYCPCIPLNPSSTQDEIQFELRNVGAKAVIFLEEDSEHIKKAAISLGITSIYLRPINSNLFPSRLPLKASRGMIMKECGLFSLHHGASTPNQHILAKSFAVSRQREISESLDRLLAAKNLCLSNEVITSKPRTLKPNDIAIILHTSGTTGTKKIVPIRLIDLCVGAFCVAASMELSSSDICCNMMPLFHVGGIVRNVFAPILAGGALICMPSVDPASFWDLCGVHHCTWYYAAPTIHMMLIEEAKKRQKRQHSIRMIANAAGGLLPSIADELKKIFGTSTVILPSYGMTECMPISCPPSNYKLERQGTSGIPVGPEVAIRGERGEHLTPTKIGRIVLRGTPLMHGYENNSQANEDAFDENGWFDTGDMGYLDEDGYLYLTGRSKEVINRGGEIISPFDVEDVVITHPSVKATVAFSVPHGKLQETIGVVIVTKPDFPRVSLKSLHRYISDKLQPAKWPQLIVFMDDVVKTHTNKVQRIGLAARMNLQEISDSTPEIERMIEATCPPKGSSITEPIPTCAIKICLEDIKECICQLEMIQQCVVKFYKQKIVAYVLSDIETHFVGASTLEEVVLEHLHAEHIHDYMIPSTVVVLQPSDVRFTSEGTIDENSLPDPNLQQGCTLPRNATEKIILDMLHSLLSAEENIGVDVDFFECGGDSMKAGQLVAQMRKAFSINLPATCVFVHRTVEKLATNIDDLIDKQKATPSIADTTNFENADADDLLSPISPKSQTNFASLFIQAIPLLFGYPLRRLTSWFIFLHFFAYFNNLLVENPVISHQRLVALIIALGSTKITMWIALPILFIVIKWTVIGRYKAGRYPLWGGYYLRWWLVDQCRKITGRGIFKHFDWSMNVYYRILGAKIGRGCTLDKFCSIAEYDLIEIGDYSVLEKKVIIRPFTSESGAMLLKQISVGDNCRVHCKASIAPGASVPDGAIIPPMASSYELNQLNSISKSDQYSTPPDPHWAKKLLIGYPIMIAIKFISLLPVLAILFAMADASWHSSVVNSWDLVIEWFLVPQRILVYLALRPVYKVVVPTLRLVCCIIAKWIVVGRFREGSACNYRFKYWFTKQMFGASNFCGVPGLIGTHYEGVSWIYRLLGAKIGKRIYWPGSGIDVVEFDLFEVGDDVVFGSRSSVRCSTATRLKKVILKSGCNVSDRCFICPGVTVGEGAVLGSGTLAAEDFYFAPKSIWVGSGAGEANCLNRGEELEDYEETSQDEKDKFLASNKRELLPSPFGEAFYLGKAPYYVFPLVLITFINIVWQSFVVAFLAFPVIASLLLADSLYEDWRRSSLVFFVLLFGILVCVNFLNSILALAIDIMAKWVLLGKRTPGEYGWNKNSYCQRWQLYLTAQRITHSGYFGRGILEWILGSAYIVWYFRALGCKIGRNVCLYPTGGDPMMTEPDLVTIGDNVAINNASVVGHINSRGQFRLNNITIKEGCTLRSYSRLLSGAEMEVGSKLLEHTLIMGGDRVSAYSVWQGWPATHLYDLPPFTAEDGDPVSIVVGRSRK